MKMRNLLLGTALALAIPAAASAQGITEGVYFGSQIGINWVDDMELEGPVTNRADFSGDLVSVVEAGYRLGSGLRFGAEVGYGTSTIGDIVGGAPGRSGGAGTVSALTFMAVAAYEIDTGSAIRPYVGGGVGVARVGINNAGSFFSAFENVDDRDTTVAYQLNAGVTYAVSEAMELSLGYRFLGADPVKLETSRGTRFETEYDSHAVMVGLRAVFGSAPSRPAAIPAAVSGGTVAPAPAAPVASAPAISRNFTVFFDFDKSTLSADAQQVLQNVARDAKTGNISNVQVSGHADTSGSTEYNLRLSQRRAEAVREYLVSQGVSAGQVAVEAQGESNLLVPTADGVREPSNRRAVVIFP